MNYISKRELLETTILNTIKNNKLDRTTFIDNNISFKKKAILIHKKYNDV